MAITKEGAKMILFIVNLIFLLIGATLITLTLYVTLDHGLISEITGSYLYLAGGYVLFFSGFMICLIVLVGIQGARTENRFFLIIYVVICIILFILFLVGGILALIYKTTMTDGAKQVMTDTLKNQYGNHRLITDAWNLTQSKLRCCGVEDRGWDIYQGSYWDRYVNADRNDLSVKISKASTFYQFVPVTCCWTLIDPLTGWPTAEFRDIDRCQHWPYGPPNHNGGAHNDAIYYRGCFEAARDYLYYHGVIIGIIGLLSCFCIIAGIISGIVLLAKIPTKDQDKEEILNEMEDEGYPDRIQNANYREKVPNEEEYQDDQEDDYTDNGDN